MRGADPVPGAVVQSPWQQPRICSTDPRGYGFFEPRRPGAAETLKSLLPRHSSGFKHILGILKSRMQPECSLRQNPNFRVLRSQNSDKRGEVSQVRSRRKLSVSALNFRVMCPQNEKTRLDRCKQLQAAAWHALAKSSTRAKPCWAGASASA